jgi:hypothetical protein
MALAATPTLAGRDRVGPRGAAVTSQSGRSLQQGVVWCRGGGPETRRRVVWLPNPKPQTPKGLAVAVAVAVAVLLRAAVRPPTGAYMSP